MYACAHRLHRLVEENVIDSQYRKSGWKRANGWRRLNEFAHMAIKCAIWSRTAETVEVAEQDERCVTGNGCAPLGTGKQLYLNEAFNPREMDEAENLHRDTGTSACWRVRVPRYIRAHPEENALLHRCARVP